MFLGRYTFTPTDRRRHMRIIRSQVSSTQLTASKGTLHLSPHPAATSPLHIQSYREFSRTMTYPSDIENAQESTPMLRRNSENRHRDRDANKPGTSRPLRVLHFFSGGIYAPDSSTYDPIEILLNTEDETEKDKLTERWRDNRLSELSFVGVVVRIERRTCGTWMHHVIHLFVAAGVSMLSPSA